MQLMEEARALLDKSELGYISKEAFPAAFIQLGVEQIAKYSEPPVFVDATTSGRPFRSGWLIYPEVPPTVSKGVEVWPGLYRY